MDFSFHSELSFLVQFSAEPHFAESRMEFLKHNKQILSYRKIRISKVKDVISVPTSVSLLGSKADVYAC